jgi:hypothetical protein
MKRIALLLIVICSVAMNAQIAVRGVMPSIVISYIDSHIDAGGFSTM